MLKLIYTRIALGEGLLLSYSLVIPCEAYQRPYDKRKIKGDSNGKINTSHSRQTKWNGDMFSMWRQ